jgi:hypothetical protein
MARCSGIRADGGRCGAQAIRGTEHCVNHHPDYENDRRRRNSKGDRRGGRGRPQTELTDIKSRLTELVEDVLGGEVDRADAAVAGQLLNTVIRAISVEMKVREIEEVSREVEDIRNLLEARKEGSSWHYGN